MLPAEGRPLGEVDMAICDLESLALFKPLAMRLAY